MYRVPVPVLNGIMQVSTGKYPYFIVFCTKVPVPVLMLIICFNTDNRNELDCVFVHRK